MMYEKYRAYLEQFPTSQIRLNEPLATYTTFGIGGPADVLHPVSAREELLKAVLAARALYIPFIILGGGSNVLVRDGGVRGLVILKKTSEIDPDYSPSTDLEKRGEKSTADFLDANYGQHQRILAAESGVNLQKLIKATLRDGLCGLEWFAGVPGTTGGALYNNAHFAGHQIDEVLIGVEYIDSQGAVRLVPADELSLDYDASAFRDHPDWVALRLFFLLNRGDTARSEKTYKELMAKRKVYAGRCSGCVFANLAEEQVQKLKLPSSSIGYINDHILGLRGMRIGGAMLGKSHANIITNENKATARDVLDILGYVEDVYRQKFGLELRREINVIGEEYPPS